LTAVIRAIFISASAYRFPILIFLLSRVVFALIAIVVNSALPTPDLERSIWYQWDSGWYLTIAQDGYRYVAESQSAVAFFPLLPVLINALTPLFGSNEIAGLAITNVAFCTALMFIYRLTLLEAPDDPNAAEHTVLYLAFHPAALFFSLIYTESLYLVVLAGALYAARRRWWGVSVAFGILCSATRIVGIFVFVFVALEWARSYGWTLHRFFKIEAWRGLLRGLRQSFPAVLAIGLIPFGLFSHMAYLQRAFGDPWLFRNVQSTWGRSVDAPFVASFGEIRTVFDTLTSGGTISLSTALNVGVCLLIIPLIIWTWRRLGSSYGLFSILTYVVAISTSLTSSLRYSAVMIPIFMALGLWSSKRRNTHYGILLLSFTLYMMLVILFLQDIYFE